MADSLFSPSWYRVADLLPRLRSHVEIHRHDYCGRIWYILQDHVSGRSQRFSPAVYRFIGLMNGKLTVQQLWDAVTEESGDQAPTQDEVIRLLGQLHSADALITNATPDSRELFRRHQRQQRSTVKQKLWTPLAIRIPLFDPDKFLQRTMPVAKLFLNRYTALIWWAVVLTAMVLAFVNWGELTENIVDRALTPTNLVLIWFIYPVVKTFHELGHAYLAKMYGGEVHEIGVMFLVLMPVPYVDVSSAWGFRDKRKRMAVGAAGIAVEMFLGSLALFVWLMVESGTAHAVAYNIMLISGVSTLLFNGNPLLRFDGYYVFADAIEIPNLGARSTQYLGYLIQRYCLGVVDAESPATNSWEKGWFVGYGVAAFLYRIYIMFVIVLYIGGRFFAVGVVLATWAIITQAIIPIGKSMRFMFNSPKLRANKKRANGVATVFVAVVFFVLFLMPASYWTKVEGVTWPSDKSQVRAKTNGFVVELLIEERSRVKEGQPIIRTRDPFVVSRVETLEARKRQFELQLRAAGTVDLVEADIIREELAVINQDLNRAKERVQALLITSPRDGLFIVPEANDLPGRFINQGDLVAFVINPDDHAVVRAVVSQDDIGLVRDGVDGVDIIAASWGSKSYPAAMVREVFGGSNQLPTAALGTLGGGKFAVSQQDSSGRTTLEPVFEIEIELPDEARTEYLGSRVYVRLDHGYRPLGLQAWRSLRQLFLRQFGV
jgi:putative peptide zinc metalloprotease protein